MKKISIFTLISIILLTGCNNKQNNLEITSTDISNCHNPSLLLTNNNQSIYTYCLDDLNIMINNKSTNLLDYLQSSTNNLDNLINNLELVSVLNDGGTGIYQGDITLIKCHTLSGNNDIYIGNKSMKYKESFCKDNNYTFIRTYTIIDIKEYQDKQYVDGIEVTYGSSYLVTLKEFQGETTEVIINNLYDNLEKNKTYEFEFMLNNSNIEDNIENIFKNTTIISINETSRVGLEQIQEPLTNHQ